MKNEADWVREFWGKDLNDADNPDSEKYKRMANDIEEMYNEIIKKLDSIESLGCIIKDPDIGLIDFYSIVNGKEVFLCWQYGENEIKYWHALSGGYNGRKSIEEIERIRERKSKF